MRWAGHITCKVRGDFRRVLASKAGGRTQPGRPSITGIILKCIKNLVKERGLHLNFSECEQVAGCYEDSNKTSRFHNIWGIYQLYEQPYIPK